MGQQVERVARKLIVKLNSSETEVLLSTREKGMDTERAHDSCWAGGSFGLEIMKSVNGCQEIMKYSDFMAIGPLTGFGASTFHRLCFHSSLVHRIGQTMSFSSKS